MSKRFVSWAAVSSEEQAKKVSLDDQRRVNREHVAKWEGTLVAELAVPGVSRSIVLFEDAMRRIEAYAQLKDLIDRRAFDVLIFLDATRLGRTHSLVAAVSGLCEQAGVLLYETASPPATLDGPIGTFDTRLLTAFKGVMSHNEIDKLVRRAYMGRQARAKKGKHAGNPPYGYQRVYDERGVSSAVIDKDQANIVRQFYDLYLNHGRSLNSICAEFTALGYVSPRSKKPWVPGTLRQMLQNCWTYAGYTTWGTYSKKGEEVWRVKAEWEPIITEEIARQVEKEQRARAYGRRAVSSANRLSMIAKCALCGGTVRISAVGGKTEVRNSAYRCANRCRGSHIIEPVMLAAIEEAIIALRDKAMIDSLIIDTPSHYSNLVDRHAEMLSALDKVRMQRRELTLVYTRNTISLDEYESIMAELQERQNNIALAVAELEEQIATTPNADTRRSRLEEVRDIGLEMLHHPDVLTANAWLRHHFVVYVKSHTVCAIEIL